MLFHAQIAIGSASMLYLSGPAILLFSEAEPGMQRIRVNSSTK